MLGDRIKELRAINKMTQKELADSIGISRSNIANSIRILNLDPRVIKLAEEGKITEGHCRNLVVIEDPEKQIAIAKKVAEKKLTVRDVEKLIYGDDKYRKKKTKKPPKSVYYQNLENKLKDYFGYKVKLDQTKKHQRLIIEYNDEEGLESLLSLLNIDM